MHRSWLIFGAYFFFLGLTPAQSYFTAGGIRLGSENGLTIKQRILKKTTVEFSALSGFKTDQLDLGLDITRHYSVISRHFNLYFGGGLHNHIFSTSGAEENPRESWHTGVALVGGVEVSLGRINVAWDYKPSFYPGDVPRHFIPSSGLSLRYIFVTNKDLRKMQRKNKRN